MPEQWQQHHHVHVPSASQEPQPTSLLYPSNHGHNNDTGFLLPEYFDISSLELSRGLSQDVSNAAISYDEMAAPRQSMAGDDVLWDGLAGLITTSAQPSISITSSPLDELADLIATTVPSTLPVFTSSFPGPSYSAGQQARVSTRGAPLRASSLSTVSSSTSSSPALQSGTGSTPADHTPPGYVSMGHGPDDLLHAGDKRKRDRERNTAAARRYRKRRVDETDELRAALAAMTKERDELKLKLVRAEAEASLLRTLHIPSSSKGTS